MPGKHLWAFASVACLLTIASAAGEDQIDVLLLSGMNNHNWKATTPALEEALEKTGRFDVTVLEKTATMTGALLADYDVIVSNFNTFVRRHAPEKESGWSAETRAALIDFVRNGKGHVTVHAGSSSFYEWPEYQRMVLGSFKVGQTDHGRQHEFLVRLKPHPITEGMSDFRTFDELWHGTDFQSQATVLATSYSSPESGGSGREEPVAVAGRFGRGRSFFLVLGHNVRGIQTEGFRVLLSRGTEWAATGRVAMPVPAKLSRDRPVDRESFQWQRDPHSLALAFGRQTVWRFNHHPKFGKAYFDPLGPVGGPVLTWAMPPDHVWHYGLWFSWKFLNGVNYWEEDKQTHRGPGRTTTTKIICRPMEDHSARIEMELSYHLAGKPPGETVLSENRIIVVSAPRTDGSYQIDWKAEFTAGREDVELNRTPLPHEKGGRSYGGYAGLSLRMRNLKDRQAFSTRGPIRFNAQNRFRGKAWAFDYSGLVDGQIGGVAICDHPKNLNAPTPWYAIRSQVMTFYMPAVICYKPFVLRSGASFTLRYRMIVHKGRLNAEQLKKLHDDFVTESSDSIED